MNQWQMIAASVPGVSHVRKGLPCQDAHRVEELARGGMVAAVADGLGSAARADRGAQVAVDVAAITLRSALNRALPKGERAWQKLLAQAFAETRSALVSLAGSEGQPLADYATTLLVAVVTKQWLAVGHLGDGAVVARLGAEETAVTLSKPQRGEFANETQPLTSPDALTAVNYVCYPGPVQALALFTDGVQQLCLGAADYTPYQPFFAPLFAQICQPFNRREAEAALIHFLQSERLGKRSDDDKTLALLGQVAAKTKGKAL